MDYFRARNIPVYRVEPPDSVLSVRRRSAFVPWRIPIQAWRTIGLSRQVGRAVRDLDPDVLYCNSVKAHVIGSFAGFFARIPVLWHFRDAFSNPIARFFFNILALLFRPAIICNSKFVADQFWRGRKAVVVHNGIPLGDIPSRRPPEELRAELGIPPAAPIIGMLGRLEEWKGHEVFLAAAAKISVLHPQTWFLIVGDTTYGDPEYKNDLKQYARELGIESRVIFTGFRSDNYNLLGLMEIYVHPSIKPEPFGRGIIEAMALAIPVVASAEGGPTEIIDNGGTGFLFEPGDADALAQVLSQMLDNPEVMSVIGRNGRSAVERRFTLKRCVDELTMILDRTLI